jgi:hypothetical protein
MSPDPQVCSSAKFREGLSVERLRMGIDELQLALRAERRDRSGNAVCDRPEVPLALAQGEPWLFGHPRVIDVGAGSTPSGASSGIVANRGASDLEASISAVEPAQPNFDFARLARCGAGSQALKQPRQLVRLDQGFPAAGPDLARTQSGIVGQRPVDEVEAGVRQRRPHQGWKRAQDAAEIDLHCCPSCNGGDDLSSHDTSQYA